MFRVLVILLIVATAVAFVPASRSSSSALRMADMVGASTEVRKRIFAMQCYPSLDVHVIRPNLYLMPITSLSLALFLSSFL